MKVVIALDSFKGSLSTAQACTAVAEGIKEYDISIETVCIPISDGGEGLIESLEPSLIKKGFLLKNAYITGPYQEIETCKYLIDGTTCVIEVAQCVGITLTNNRDTKNATSYGLGQAVLQGLKQGARNFIIGLGGSATNDCGVGFAQALGAKFYDIEGNEMTQILCGKDLASIKHIDTSSLPAELKECTFTGTCDVSNPLYGENGATYVYGPQKGASQADLDELEKGVINYATVLKNHLNKDYSNTPGAGAAGGLGAALLWICNAKLCSGINTVLDLVDFDKQLKDSQLVFVGEGRMDGQSANGKAPMGVAQRALKQNIPTVALCGSVLDSASKLYAYGINSMFAICDGPMDLNYSMQNCYKLLKNKDKTK